MPVIRGVNFPKESNLKNYLINGDMKIAQRAASSFSTASGFVYGGADRWSCGPFSYTTLTGTCNKTQLTGSTSGWGQAFVGTATGTGTIQFYQRLEASNVFNLNSKTITVSFKFYQNTGSSQSIGLQISKPGSLDNWTTPTSLVNPTFTCPNNVVTSFQYSYTLGSVDASNGLEVRIYMSSGAFTSSFVEIADVM